MHVQYTAFPARLMQNLRGAAPRVSRARETTFQPARSQLGGAGEPFSNGLVPRLSFRRPIWVPDCAPRTRI